MTLTSLTLILMHYLKVKLKKKIGSPYLIFFFVWPHLKTTTQKRRHVVFLLKTISTSLQLCVILLCIINVISCTCYKLFNAFEFEGPVKISFFRCWKQHDAFYCSRHRPKAINASGKMVWSIYWSNIKYPFYYLVLSKKNYPVFSSFQFFQISEDPAIFSMVFIGVVMSQYDI